jgi:hypothetical protein
LDSVKIWNNVLASNEKSTYDGICCFEPTCSLVMKLKRILM